MTLPLTIDADTGDSVAALLDGPVAGAPLMEPTGAPPRYAGVIDIGSGSARAVVMRVNAGGGIEVMAQQRINLNLMSHVDADGILDAAGVAGALDAIEDFALIAQGYGVKSIQAVGTAALRESGNAAAITDAAANRFGIPMRIISGADEAAYCFIGAIHGLRVTEGLMADIGGGSCEIVKFSDRTMQKSVSLPLGSLRLANRFRLTDRPAPDDLRAAYQHVRAVLAEAKVPPLTDRGALVGSGGSVRLLSRLARGREPYPIIKMHGYQIGVDTLAEQSRSLAVRSRRQRNGMAGMNPERSHSIVGGAVVAHALAQHVAAGSILVSGQGLREGLARHPDTLPAPEQIGLPSLAAVRKASLIDLAQRFAPRFRHRGQRRAALAGRIAAAAWQERHHRLAGSLQCAALLLDIGNAIDFYNRLNRTASIIVRTDLPGFTHRESAQIAAILLAAERNQLPRRFRDSRLLTGPDGERIGQAAAMLVLADELEGRLPPGCPDSAVSCGRHSGQLTVTTPGWSAVAAPGLETRWKAVFGENIHIARRAL